MKAARVAVTGLGLLTGAGLDLESSWAGLLEARSPARRFTIFDPSGLATPFGVELPSGAADLFRSRIKTRHRSLMTRGTCIAVVAADMAIVDSGLDLSALDRSRIGVVVGTTGTGYVREGTGPDPNRILRNMSNSPASWISLTRKLGGPSFTVSTACSSGAYALAAGFALVEGGLCDAVVAGAADSSLNRDDVEGFGALMALSEDADDPAAACRPFDRRRTGFVMGEGGGFLLLERIGDARARGARILAEMSLPGLTSESYNIMSPEPGGGGMASSMRLALDLAGLSPADIDHVNAHGTSTALNDLYEAQAILSVFGPRASALPVSSTKAVTGHCLAGAAGVEAAICVKAIVEGTIPPTANLVDPDPEIGIHVVSGGPRRAALGHVMSNSFAFGGHNGVCIFSRAG